MSVLKLKPVVASLIAATYLFSPINTAQACTSLVTTDVNGNAYHGRTLEFTIGLPSALTYMPSGTKIESVTSTNTRGLTFDTKYPILAMTATWVKGAKQPLILDGFNDQGLSLSANALLTSSSPYSNADDARMLSGNDFGAWILGNFQTVAQVKQAMKTGEIQFWLPLIPTLGNLPTPLHYAIHDKKGNGIVVEFEDGKTNVYDNPVNVMTNGPSFPWHIANLSNYTFNNIDKNSGQLGKLKLVTQDSGIALTALPSAQTSQGRFVKAAFYANYVTKGKNPDDAINKLAHIMNNFDRPDGLTADAPGGIGDAPRGNTYSSEVTDYTVMKDLARGQYFVRSINALNWAVVDITMLKGLSQIKSISTYDIDKSGADVYGQFMK